MQRSRKTEISFSEFLMLRMSLSGSTADAGVLLQNSSHVKSSFHTSEFPTCFRQSACAAEHLLAITANACWRPTQAPASTHSLGVSISGLFCADRSVKTGKFVQNKGLAVRSAQICARASIPSILIITCECVEMLCVSAHLSVTLGIEDYENA